MRNPNPALYKFKWKDYIMRTGLMDIYIYIYIYIQKEKTSCKVKGRETKINTKKKNQD